jgi:hypothetical protein
MDATPSGRGYRALLGRFGAAMRANMVDRLISWKDNDIVGFH